MSAIYDGNLIIRNKVIEPCCPDMGRLVFKGNAKVSVGTKLIAARVTIDGVSYPLRYCPCCGAKLEVV